MEMENYATEDELTVVVKFDYQPHEEMVVYPNEDAHPGCDASVDINEVCHNGQNIIHLIDTDEMQRLEYECFDFLDREE